MKLWEALKFSNERRAEHPIADSLHPLVGTDAGVERFAPVADGSCITSCVMETWANMDPKLRKALLHSESWKPVDPKPPLVILAEAANHWETNERLAERRD